MRRVHERRHVAGAADRGRSTSGRICQTGATGQGARLILQPIDLTLLQRRLLLLLKNRLHQCLICRQTPGPVLVRFDSRFKYGTNRRRLLNVGERQLLRLRGLGNGQHTDGGENQTKPKSHGSYLHEAAAVRPAQQHLIVSRLSNGANPRQIASWIGSIVAGSAGEVLCGLDGLHA